MKNVSEGGLLKPDLINMLDDSSKRYVPAKWLYCVVPQREPFYPQMDDEIVYFRQGFCL